ncbi:hypothetical protein ACJX0J_018944 [Zea mays]
MKQIFWLVPLAEEYVLHWDRRGEPYMDMGEPISLSQEWLAYLHCLRVILFHHARLALFLKLEGSLYAVSENLYMLKKKMLFLLLKAIHLNYMGYTWDSLLIWLR